MDLKILTSTINQISAERGIQVGEVITGIEEALAAAYKKQYREKSEIVKAKLDVKTGIVKFWLVKTVVDETTVRMNEEEEKKDDDERPRYNPFRHLLLTEARQTKTESQLGDEIEFVLEEQKDFGRIAAQTAKQVILQKFRESEREAVKAEFENKEGEIVSGTVQRFDRGNVFVDLGRTVGVMFINECIPGEHYRIGQRMKFFVLAVQKDSNTPGIILSRNHPQFVAKLFELEVPEVAEQIVEIKDLAREPGHRTKVAVSSKEKKVDPVGSMVGQRGTRVMAVTNELGNEKIDIVEWSPEPEKFVANAFSPAKVVSVEILPRREARVYANEDQLSLVLGKGGENVRLAAKLTGWKIDVRSLSRPEEIQEEGVAEAESESESKSENEKAAPPESEKEITETKSEEAAAE